MPSMPRSNSKATKIAYKIQGIPANIKSHRDKAQQAINKRLIFEETQRVR